MAAIGEHCGNIHNVVEDIGNISEHPSSTDTPKTDVTSEQEEGLANQFSKMSSKDVCQFYLSGRCRFGEKCLLLHPADTVVPKVQKTNPNTRKPNKQKKKMNPDDEIYTQKKPPMKTAGDVRDRIVWDSDLPKEEFTIGYVDRFVGLVERPFAAFVWGDLCDAEPDDLSIPQHCISYFKYRDVKVWDKETRMDHVFGSAGNKLKITEKMSQIDQEIMKSTLEYDSDSSDCDGEFNINVGNAVVGKEKAFSDDQNFLRASHFLCIKVKNPQITETAKNVQESIYFQDPSLRECSMPLDLLHVTLTMIHCEDEEAINRVSDILDSLIPKLKLLTSDDNSTDQRTILASGVSTFGSRVLYAKLQVPKVFYEIIELLQASVRRTEGVSITNNFEFVPHMTLMKIGRPKERERRSKYMNSTLYDEFLDQTFGEMIFDNIHFCLIDNSRGADGFYHTHKVIDF